MAKKKGTFGKFIAFTTAIAAIGGACYVFRDKIQDSSLFKSASGKANDLYDTVKAKFNSKDDDFFFDDDDFFDDDIDKDEDNSNDLTGNQVDREYTSISIKQAVSEVSESEKESDKKTDTDNELSNNSDVIPTINFDKDNASKKPDNSSESNSPTAYENEGLSDVSEDPDVLEDMDKLDF